MKKKTPKKWPAVLTGLGLAAAGAWATVFAGLHGTARLTLLAAGFWFATLFALPLFFLRDVLSRGWRRALLGLVIAYVGFVGVEAFQTYTAPPCPALFIPSTRKAYQLTLRNLLGQEDLSSAKHPGFIFLCSRPFGVLILVRIEKATANGFRLHAISGRQLPGRSLRIQREIERPLQPEETRDLFRLLDLCNFFSLPALLQAEESDDLSKRKVILRCLGFKPLEYRCAHTLFAVEAAVPSGRRGKLRHHVVLRTNRESSEEFRALCDRFCGLAGLPHPDR